MLFIAQNEISGTPRGRIEVVNTTTSVRKYLKIEDCSYARYTTSGHLLYAVGDEVHGVAFDLNTLSVKGKSKIVLQDVFVNQQGRAQFDVADDGTLVYLAGTGFRDSDRTLVWIDTEGTISPFTNRRGAWTSFDLSPNENRVALAVNGDILILDKAEDSLRPLTRSDDLDKWPLWSVDNKSVYFYSNRDHRNGLWRKVADFSDTPPEFICEFGSTEIHCTTISTDGSYLLAFQMDAGGDFDIWRVSLGENPVAQPLLSEDYYEGWPMLSPGYDWVAYIAAESRRKSYVYIKPIKGSGGSKQIASTDGSVRPLWSTDSNRLLYESRGKIFSVALTFNNGELIPGNQKVEQPLPQGAVLTEWTLSSDDQRILVLVDAAAHTTENDPPSGPTHLKMISNFFTELKEKVPVDQN